MTMQVLHLEDNPDDALLVKKLLAKVRDPMIEVEQVDHLEAARKRLAEGGIDLVLSDMKLPDSTELDTFRSLRAQAPHTPIILLTGTFEETKLALKAIQQGAQDYLFKHEITTALLERSVRYAIERKRAEETLTVSEARYRRLFETAHDGIFLLDATTGQITDVNPFLIQLLGYSKDEFLGKRLWEVGPFKDIEACQTAFKELQINNYIRYEDLPLQTKDGRTVEVEFVSNTYWVDGQQVIQCNVRDITARQQAEQERVRQQKITLSLLEDAQRSKEQLETQHQALEVANARLQELAALKDEFTSTVSHELRTPLAITREGISLVLDQVPGPVTEKQRNILMTAQQHIDRLARLINDLLDIARLEEGRLELHRDRVDLTALIHEVVGTFQARVNAKGLGFSVKGPERQVAVYADADKIIQVLTNLLDNALKFTHHGAIEVSVHENPDDVVCTVADTGQGISPEDLPKLFGKFVQLGRTPGAGDKGAGLGLAIAKGFIERHQGTMQVSSEQGSGTTFTFTLPRYLSELVLNTAVSEALDQAKKRGEAFSLISVALCEPTTQRQALLEGAQRILKEVLRRKSDQALNMPEGAVILLPECDTQGASSVAARMTHALAAYVATQGLNGAESFAIGCASYPHDASHAEELIEHAKQAGGRTTAKLRKVETDERSPRILVVDDEPELVELVQMRLEAHGYEVLTASDGSEGLDRARAAKPDLIVLDLMLPKLDGYKVCTMLKGDPRYRAIPIVIFTAKTQASDEQIARDCGADAYLRKPFRPEEMLATIQTLLAAAHNPKGGAAMNPMTAQKRILVVDDEQDMLVMMSERLTNWGYEVLTTDNGEEGWRLITEHLPDLVLLDIMMPKLKGRDLCELLKAHPQTRDIPVIFLTALSLPDHIKAGLDVGADDYIVKPFQPEDLKDRIRVCLLRHTPQPQNLDAGGTAARS